MPGKTVFEKARSFFNDWKVLGQILTTLLTGAGAVGMYLYDKHVDRAQSKRQRQADLELERRERELDLINRQLQDLYGPLHAIASTGSSTSMTAQASGLAYRKMVADLLELKKGVRAEPHSKRDPGLFSVWQYWNQCAGKRMRPDVVNLHRQWYGKIQ